MSTKRTSGHASIGKTPVGQEVLTNYGDLRITKGAMKVVQAWSGAGSASFPSMLGEAGSEALYELLANDKFAYEKALSAHAALSAARAKDFSGIIIAAHDTSSYDVAIHHSETIRENYAVKTSRTQGFELHASVLMAHDSTATPLGVASLLPFVHQSQTTSEESREYWLALGGLYDNEHIRWFEGIQKTATLLGDKAADTIHVCDREGDSFDMLAWMAHEGHRFVIRGNRANRKILVNGKRIAIEDALVGEPIMAKVLIKLGNRSQPKSAKDKENNPERKARNALLSVRFKTVDVAQPIDDEGQLMYKTDVREPATLRMTLVDVREEHPPNGQKPVRWLLLTSEPVHTAADALNIVDIYRCRWGIEVFFKVLKTGLKIEERQMNSADAMLRVLALAMPTAIAVQRMSHMAEMPTNARWSAVVSNVQLAVLKRKCPKAGLSLSSTAKEVMFAVAQLGGFLKSNKKPGWQTMYKGWRYLDALVEGYELARQI